MSNKINIPPNVRILMICFVITAVALAVFGQLRQYDFVNFDDHIYVTENRYIQSGVTPESIRWAFSTTYAEFWHPLTWLSLMADYQVFGLHAGGYHLTNVILHIMSSLLLFWLFNRMTGALWRSAFIAAFFAFHPLHVESVAWIAERKDVLSAFFWMLTLCLYVLYTEKPVIHRYLLVLTGFACGLMSKSMVVTLPVVLILLDYWPLDRLKSRAFTGDSMMGKTTGKNQVPQITKSKNTKKKNFPPPEDRESIKTVSARMTPLGLLREKIPFFALSAIFAMITLYAQRKPFDIHFPLEDRIANALISYVKYLFKMVWPDGLAVFYPFPVHISALHVAGAALLILAVTASVVLFVKRLPYLFVGWSWYAVTVLPVIGMIQIGDFSMADRYTYLPAIGISIILAWGFSSILQRVGPVRKLLFPAGIICLAILAALSWRQCGVWKNSMELFHHALQVTEDNPLARNSLGLALAAAGRNQEAIAQYQAAIRINPHYDEAHSNLGVALMSEGKVNEAIVHYRAALDVRSDSPSVHCNIGSALALAGKFKEAQEHYRTAIQLKPDYDDAYFNFANLLAKQGHEEEALKNYRRALDINPRQEEAHANMAEIFMRQEKISDAIDRYLEILKINPSSFRALNNLGVSFEKQSQHEKAIYYYSRALNMEPSNPGVHFNLGVALANKGDKEGAIEHFRMAVSLNPDFEQARRMLKAVQKTRGGKR